MPISASCPNCNAAFQLEERLAGKTVRCQKCQTAFMVPTAAAPVPSVDLAGQSENEEIVDAQLAQPPAAQEEIIDAKVVKLPGKKTTPPAPKSSPKQQQQQQRRAPSPPVSQSASALIVIGLALVLCLGTLVAGGIGSFWLIAHQPNPGPIVVAPRIDEGPIDIEEPDFHPQEKIAVKVGKTEPPKFDDRFAKTEPPKKEIPFLKPILLTLDVDGKVSVREKLKRLGAGEQLENLGAIEGRFQAFRVNLKQGKRYNFLCKGTNLKPIVMLYYQNRGLENGWNGDSETCSFLTYNQQREDEHIVLIKEVAENPGDEFELSIASATERPSDMIEVNGRTPVVIRDEIKLSDSSFTDNRMRPFRLLRLNVTPGVKYRITVADQQFPVALTISQFKLKSVLNYDTTKGPVSFEYETRAEQSTNPIFFIVTGTDCPVGKFSLTVAGNIGLPNPVDGDAAGVNFENRDELEGIGTREFKVNLSPSPFPYPRFAWHPDGEHFSYISDDGYLRSVHRKFLQVSRKIYIATDGDLPRAIYATPSGIAIPRPLSRECWLLDWESLEIKKRLPEHASYLISHPLQSAILFPASSSKYSFRRYDLANPDAAPQELSSSPKLTNYNYTSSLSPDGRYFLGSLLNTDIVKFNIQGNQLKPEKMPFTWPAGLKAVISPDQELLMRHYDKDKDPKPVGGDSPRSGYGWIGYRLNDPTKPAFVLDTGEATSWLDADPKLKLLYTYNSLKGLIIADYTGRILKEIKRA